MATRGRHIAPRLRRIPRGWVIPITLAMSLVLGGVAWADNFQNDVTAGGNDTIIAGGSTTITYRLVANSAPGGDIGGCNVDLGNPATVTITAPSQVTNDVSGSFQFTECGNTGAKQVVYSSATAGSYLIGVTISGGKAGALYNDQADFTLHVNAPSNQAPQVAANGLSVTVNEGSVASMTGTWSDADAGDVVALSASIGSLITAGSNSGGTWSWSHTPDDGPSNSQVVTITADDGTETATATFDLIVDNVAPTASLSANPGNVFTGTTVTYNALATDPSSADTTTGFTWSFDDGATWTANAQLQRAYTTCGLKTESVVAQDKDGGISDPASAGVSVYDGGWHGAIKPAMRNLVQAGRVVPVQIQVSCDGVSISGLTPAIQLLNGEFDPGTDPGDEAVLAPTSVSAADTTGFMRPTADGYIYNLQIPSNASKGQFFTIRVRPWGSSGAVLQALIEIRK